MQTLLRTIYTIRNHIFDIVFPPLCLHCGQYIKEAPHGARALHSTSLICKTCETSITRHTTLFCPLCRARLPENTPICSHAHNTQYLLGAVGDYSDPVLQTLIRALKYQRLQSVALILGNLLSKYLLNIIQPNQNNYLLVPIPLHPARERERGFNQARLLAQEIKSATGIPIIEGLVRIKNTEAQAKMNDRETRKINIENCFAWNPRYHTREIRKKNIFLIDDVSTSGATLQEAVHVLRKHGAKKIIALVVAKA